MHATVCSQLVVDGRWCGQDGIGRFSREVLRRLPTAQRLCPRIKPLHPFDCVYLGFAVRRRQPDCFFSPGFNAPLFGDRPFVFTIHDLIHLECREESSLGKFLYYELVAKRAARRAHCVLTVSEYSKQKILAWAGLAPEQVVVVYNGVDPVFRAEGLRHEPGYDYLFYVGNQKPHKNIDRLLAAASQVMHERPLRLIMTGRPAAKTLAQIQRWGIESHVIFTGPLSDEQLAAYYRGAKLLVLPSLFEGFGLPLVEAMACGTPVVCANATSLPEVAGSAAELVDPYDAGEIAAGMRRVLDDPAKAERMRAAGLERSQQFTWDATAARVRNVLEAAAASGQRRATPGRSC